MINFLIGFIAGAVIMTIIGLVITRPKQENKKAALTDKELAYCRHDCEACETIAALVVTSPSK